MRSSSAWGSVVARWFVIGAVGAVLLLPGCDSEDTPTPEHLVVQTASGTPMDLTGSEWARCNANEPSAGMSRLKGARFAAGTFTATEVVYVASTDCTGATDPAQGKTATAKAAAQGEREAGWDNGAPTGLPATVTATAVLLSGFTPSGIPDLKTLLFVNDLASPRRLHMGGEIGVAPDGYPTTLESSGQPRAGP
jgi:hypothetical protein